MNVINKNKADRIFDTFNYTFMTILILIVLYPLYLIVISSVSNPYAVNSGTVWLIPEGFTMEGYKKLFEFGKVWLGYRNSLFYAALGTVLNLSLTLTAGYALSRHDLVGRNFFMFVIAFTMFFGGGIIPTYLLVKELGMVNTIWSQVIPNAVSAFNIIIARTFFQTTIPKGLLEAAQVDGCSTTKFFFKIVLPLSVPIIAVIALFSAVAHWNSYFQALIYLRNESLYPLQIILREILIVNESQGDTMVISPDSELQDVSEIMKYGAIIITSLPVLILYPFVQKYFVKGVMIGSIKE
ncbi:carbohydrate ABC transporter permease [Bacillus sp. FSL K6-3431]|uniref:carbohydrate ABC transporter permease n=1 Tax=Bacillus sp. FSL K6-3431 TaxID=2921500 RepID=UPI0030F55321